MITDLKEVVKIDCATWESFINKDNIFNNYLYLNECKNSNATGFYQLVLNGVELFYGTLSELNAIIKTLCLLTDPKQFKKYNVKISI